ncbi:MAG TPA: ABC transporter permease [Roseiarcus sp.]|nr:ABC transporter permease [Roseiarcus sp.]
MSEADEDVAVPNTPVAALIPHDTVSGRALTAVIAILTFLACLCAGGGVLLAASTSAWRSDVSREITIQVRPHAGADADAEVNKLVIIASASPAVATVNAMSRADTEKSLAPWLGAGLDLSQLPIPRLVVVRLASRDPAAMAALRAAIAKAAPDAMFDDHMVWLSHLTTVGRYMTLFATLLFLLVAAAIAIAIGFATRGAMAGAREIVEVLHFVGASDRFITRHFQRYFFRLSAEGTGVGGAAAIVLFLIGEFAAARGANGPDGVAMTVLIGSFRLPLVGYAAILGVCVLLVAMAGLFARIVAAAHLRALS